MIIRYKVDLYTILVTTEAELNSILANIGRYYYTKRKPKFTDDGTRRKNKDGSNRDRIINPSTSRLKEMQECITNYLSETFELPDYMYGGVEKRNNILNASAHKGNKYKFKTDIQDFYSFITCGKVRAKLIDLGFPPKIAMILTRLTTYNGHLPQGAPSSVFLANLVFTDTGNKIQKLAAEHNITYTSYIDDVVLSSKTDFKSLTLEVISILREDGFRINNKKTDYISAPMEITGVICGNNYLSPNSKFRNKINTTDTKTPEQIAGLYAYLKQIHKISPKRHKVSAY